MNPGIISPLAERRVLFTKMRKQIIGRRAYSDISGSSAQKIREPKESVSRESGSPTSGSELEVKAFGGVQAC
jgi:hypothetical protein